MYTTDEDVQQVLTPITGQGRGGWTLKPEDVNHHIVDAQAEIDAALAHLYTVPFADYPDTPSIIREICQDIAAYLCMLQAQGGVEVPKDHPVRLRYERKKAILDRIASGDQTVPGVDEETGIFAAVNTGDVCRDYWGRW